MARYGEPRRLHFSAAFQDFECELVRRSAAKGRNHDLTCFILHNGGYVVIQKHDYGGTGIYRAPSGGAHIGESLEDAARREMYEETGLHIRLLRFVLDVSLDVICSEGTMPWRSLVFLAESVSGTIGAIDTREIYDVILMTREQLLGEVRQLMLESGWGGFRYRAFLTESFFETLDSLRSEDL